VAAARSSNDVAGESDEMKWDDADVLHRLQHGLMTVDLNTLEVKSWHARRKRMEAKKPNQNRGRWRFVLGGKRTIYRNKLVWMAAHKQLVPQGMVVDHVNGDRTDDRLLNLKLMTAFESCRQGNTIQRDTKLESAEAFFDHILWYGVPPTKDFCGITGANDGI